MKANETVEDAGLVFPYMEVYRKHVRKKDVAKTFQTC